MGDNCFEQVKPLVDSKRKISMENDKGEYLKRVSLSWTSLTMEDRRIIFGVCAGVVRYTVEHHWVENDAENLFNVARIISSAPEEEFCSIKRMTNPFIPSHGPDFRFPSPGFIEEDEEMSDSEDELFEEKGKKGKRNVDVSLENLRQLKKHTTDIRCHNDSIHTAEVLEDEDAIWSKEWKFMNTE